MANLPALSFRFKILLLIIVILSGAIGSTMIVTQRRVQATYQKLFARQYETQIDFFNSQQRLRLANVMARSQDLADDEEFLTALRAGDAAAVADLIGLPSKTEDGQRAAERPRPGEFIDLQGAKLDRGTIGPRTYVKVYDAEGSEIMGLGKVEQARRLPQVTLKYYKRLVAESTVQQVGYYRGAAEQGLDYLVSVVVTPANDPTTQELVGAIVMGFQVMDFGGLERAAPVQSGIILEGDLFSSTIPVTLRPVLLAGVNKSRTGESTDASSFDIMLNDIPYRCFVKPLNPGSVFPVALNISLYSLADQYLDIREMRLRVLAFGTVVFVGGCLLAWLLSQRLAIPLNELVVGTREIEKGNYQYSVKVRSGDEVGQLAASFNQMAEGLAQKEKFQSVLNQVADREVADKLLAGEIALGGVTATVTVLFCDIRGFSVMSQNMPPAEVVRMLNEHMTALTRVAYEFRGVVDKFVGDMIMVVFGAPKSYGNDAESAVRCALSMIKIRRELNETSQHRIQVGIGISTGEVLAGCMGSEDRLNYTVLGEKVNLGSRLCDMAGQMEILIDENTRLAIGESAELEALDAMHLKGFKDRVKAFRVVKLRGH